MACDYGKFQDVVGSNPDTGYWMDIFQIFLQKLQCFLDKTEYKNDKKRPLIAHFKNYLFTGLECSEFLNSESPSACWNNHQPNGSKMRKKLFFH